LGGRGVKYCGAYLDDEGTLAIAEVGGADSKLQRRRVVHVEQRVDAKRAVVVGVPAQAERLVLKKVAGTYET
jgi:hypothetical protein